jgi:Fur family ferric uptake transcriptional regulator
LLRISCSKCYRQPKLTAPSGGFFVAAIIGYYQEDVIIENKMTLQETTYSSESLKAELNAKGWRMTPQREVILSTFQHLPEGEHLSAEDLYYRLQTQGENISLSTIYRTVKLMARMGILRELELTEDHKHYEINQPRPHHHHHLVCVKTNRIIEFKNDQILTISQKVADKYGFKVLDCQLTIIGVSPEGQRSIF